MKRAWVYLLALAIISMMGFATCTTNNLPTNATRPLLKSDSAVTLPSSFGFGRHATKRQIDSLDIDIMPDGTGLPHDSGNALIGKSIYLAKCAVCHGKTGVEGKIGGALVSLSDTAKEKTIGNYWPYATTVYDYINRAMPFNAPGTLKASEVYSLTAYVLSANHIIDSTYMLNDHSLSKVVMPARDLFVPDDRKGGPEIR